MNGCRERGNPFQLSAYLFNKKNNIRIGLHFLNDISNIYTYRYVNSMYEAGVSRISRSFQWCTFFCCKSNNMYGKMNTTMKLCFYSTSIFSIQDSTYSKNECIIRKSVKFWPRTTLRLCIYCVFVHWNRYEPVRVNACRTYKQAVTFKVH